MSEKQIVDYQIVHVSDALKKNGNKLASRVKEEMSNGWLPFGGPMIMASHFFQAMVKYKK